jgi:hypothetical protein
MAVAAFSTCEESRAYTVHVQRVHSSKTMKLESLSSASVSLCPLYFVSYCIPYCYSILYTVGLVGSHVAGA